MKVKTFSEEKLHKTLSSCRLQFSASALVSHSKRRAKKRKFFLRICRRQIYFFLAVFCWGFCVRKRQFFVLGAFFLLFADLKFNWRHYISFLLVFSLFVRLWWEWKYIFSVVKAFAIAGGQIHKNRERRESDEDHQKWGKSGVVLLLIGVRIHNRKNSRWIHNQVEKHILGRGKVKKKKEKRRKTQTYTYILFSKLSLRFRRLFFVFVMCALYRSAKIREHFSNNLFLPEKEK